MMTYQEKSAHSFCNHKKSKVLGLILAIAFTLAPVFASADPILIDTIGDPIGEIKLSLYVTPDIHNGTYYTDYQAKVTPVDGFEDLAASIGSPVELFCVENQSAHVNEYEIYKLYALDTSSDENLWVAWIAENYWNATDTQKGLAQQAIWSILGTVSISLTDDIEAIITAAKDADISADILSRWMIAKNGSYQDYLVRVPEPATLMLLGTGLLGIGLITRRKIQK